MKPEDEKLITAVKNHIIVERVPCTTYVYALAVAKNNDENPVQKIVCKGGFTPVGGYVYDRLNESYVVQCLSYVPVGPVPFGISISTQTAPNWKTFAPIPLDLLLESFTDEEMYVYNKLREKYPVGDYDITFLQMIR